MQVCTCRNARRLIETPRTFKLRKFTNKFVRRALFLPRPSLPPPLFFLFLFSSPPSSDLPNEHRPPSLLFALPQKSLIKRQRIPSSLVLLRVLLNLAADVIQFFSSDLYLFHHSIRSLKGRPCSHKEET